MPDLKFPDRIGSMISDKKWLIEQNEYHSDMNLSYETKFALCNGYMGTRGSFEEGSLIENQGNFLAGIFDKAQFNIREIVNTQSWIGLKLYVNDEPLEIDRCRIENFKRVLDMKKSILFKSYVLEDKEGRRTQIEGYRFLSRSNVHRAGIKMFITPLNYEGTVSVENIIDGSTTSFRWNPRFRTKHYDVVENTCMNGFGDYLEIRTKDDKSYIGIGTSVLITEGSARENVIKMRRFAAYGEISSELLSFFACENRTYQIEKYAATYTSRDARHDEIKSAVLKELGSFMVDGFDLELERHIAVYEKLWKTANIDIEGDEKADLALRFSIFHLMSSGNENDEHVSIGAKAMHGEGYFGHAFWDTEIFMLPFFLYSNPAVAKNLLMFRYHNIEGAREKARMNNLRGAQYPWESTNTGREECPEWFIDHNGRAIRNSCWDTEYHITADVAYAVYEYVRVTGDNGFMVDFGAEILIETARFWASIFEYNKEYDRYELHKVIGPDEFHEHVDNNFYTNYLAKWNILKALEVLEFVRQSRESDYIRLLSKICLTKHELDLLNTVAEKIYLPYDCERKLMEQFDGYFKKKDYVLDKYDKNGMPVVPEGVPTYKTGRIHIFDMNATRLLKQADVVMLHYLLEDDFDYETKKINYEYYEKRTMHKSSLSPSIYAVMGIKTGDYLRAYDYFMKTATVDLADNQGNSCDGLHAASTGGTWQVAMFGFAGMKFDKEGMLSFNPWLPEKWSKMTFNLMWRNLTLGVEIQKGQIKIDVLDGLTEDLVVKVNGSKYQVVKALVCDI